MEFIAFKTAVAKQFEQMARQQLFRVHLDKDKLYECYLSAFPEGTNEKFRERTSHDCSACKSFIKAVGNVVAFVDNKLVSIWDVGTIVDEPAYTIVAAAMSAHVKQFPVTDVFLHSESKAGSGPNLEELLSGEKITWNHFFVNIPSRFYKDGDDIPTALATPRESKQVFLRGVKELAPDAIEVVLDLISQNSLYRGEQYQHTLTEFQKLQKKALKLPADELDAFAWTTATSGLSEPILRLNNISIGVLLANLTKGMDLEAAVRSFESNIVGAANYKRPTALISKVMIEKAQKTITEMGLMSATDRRHAKITDLTINNLLFADRSVKKTLAQDIFSELTASVAVNTKSLDKLEEVPIAKFLGEVVPRASSIDLLFEPKHVGNLVSLLAPVDPTAGKLFAWDNNFSWSYHGGLGDSIKERVKQAGGNVTGDLCCRLAWHNHDDLDFHMFEPDRTHINFRDKTPVGTTGQLDVDMNAGFGRSRTPVENIFYPDRRRMKEGVYQLEVHNFNKRESIDVGFEVEFDWLGDVTRITCDRGVANNERVAVVRFKYTHEKGVEIVEINNQLKQDGAGVPGQTVWGITTRQFHKVKAMMLSPNYWNDVGVGNKHLFLMLEGCATDEKARGFLNEFLRPELNPHRKVFEALGAKMMVDPVPDQLSGLGFSSTKHDSFVCRIHGSFTRMIRVVI